MGAAGQQDTGASGTIARAPGLAHRPRALRPQGTGTRHKPPAVRASTGWMTSMFHTHWDIVFLKTQKASDTDRQPRLSEAPLADQAERGHGFRSTGREWAEARGLSGRGLAAAQRGLSRLGSAAAGCPPPPRAVCSADLTCPAP